MTTRVISVQNYKGGTGKTTTVVNLGMALALRGQRVLAVDLDPQGSVANCLGASFQHSVSDVLAGKVAWGACLVNARTRFDILAADRQLVDTEALLRETAQGPEALANRLAGIATAGYDYVFLDCAASIGLLSECALLLAQEVFVPVSMEYLALVGARSVVIEVLRSRRLANGHSANLSLVIPTFYAAALRRTREVLELMQRHFPGIVSNPIRACTALSEAPSHHRTIFEYDARGVGSRDYAQLAELVASGEAAPAAGIR
jgi:chromosome partitioning protein